MDDTELIAEVNNDEKSVTMEVPSVNSKVKVDVTVSVMGRKVSFYVENNMDTLIIEILKFVYYKMVTYMIKMIYYN